MKPTELQRRLLAVGAVEAPTSYPPPLAGWWMQFSLCGRAFEVPRLDKPGADALADEVVEEISLDDAVRRAGIRIDWPEWLDSPIDRCPACGGEDVVIGDDEAGGWASECRPTSCGAVYRWPGALPTWAAWMAETARGRWALHGLGHPLGVAR